MKEYHGYVETELKLAINISDIPLLKQQPLLQRHCKQEPTVKQLLSVYYDTPDICLRKHKLSLRIRRADESWVQTVKMSGSVSEGLHQRKEWQCLLELPQPNLSETVIPASLHALLTEQPHLARQIQPIFYTNFERILWQIEWSDGAKIELVLDIGKITKDHANATICEVECELNQGSVEQLIAFVEQLRKVVPLTPMNESKASRGYALIETLKGENP